MTDIFQNPEDPRGSAGAERAAHEGDPDYRATLRDEFRRAPGEIEADVEHIGHEYPAVVTAHFPDESSAERALEQIRQVSFSRPEPIQVFTKEPPDTTGDENDPGLEPGEIAIIVQLDDESQGPDLVRICEEAGAKHARHYPSQHLGHR